MVNKTYIYCGSYYMSIMKLYLLTGMLPQFEMVTLLLGHPVLGEVKNIPIHILPIAKIVPIHILFG